MSDLLKARAEAEGEREEVRARNAKRTATIEERTLDELRSIRRQLFWGPFWAIIATGAVAMILWALTLLF